MIEASLNSTNQVCVYRLKFASNANGNNFDINLSIGEAVNVDMSLFFKEKDEMKERLVKLG